MHSEGQIALPEDVWRHLGLRTSDRVAIVICDDGTVELCRPRFTLESVMGSIPALPNQSEDFEREIEEAMEEHIAEKMKRWKDQDSGILNDD